MPNKTVTASVIGTDADSRTTREFCEAVGGCSPVGVSNQDKLPTGSELVNHWAAFVVVLACLVGFSSRAAQSSGNEQVPALTRLVQVVSLTPEDAAKGLLVKVKGTVTYCNRDEGRLVVQDGNEAVEVRIPTTRENDERDPQIGEALEVEGVTQAGRLAPRIWSKTRRALGKGEMPAAFDLNGPKLFAVKAQNRWARVRGWIPFVNTLANRLVFTLVVRPGQTIDVRLDADDFSQARSLAGSYAEVTGVFSLKLDSTGGIAGGRLNVTGLGNVQPSRTLPIGSIAEIGNTVSHEKTMDPFRIRGIVVDHALGEFLVVKDLSGSMRVPYRGLSYYNPGSLVELFAYPLKRFPELVMTNIMVKIVPPDSSNEEPPAVISPPTAPNTNLATLVKISQVRKLSAQEASRGYPVAIEGVVTYCDRTSYLQFIQDGTSGIYFDLTKIDSNLELHPGKRIRVQGFSGPGDYAPVLISQSVEVLGEAKFPAPENVSFSKLMNGDFDSQWVLLQGVVRNQWLETNSSTLALFAGDGLMKVVLHAPLPSSLATNFIDAGVEVRGVCRTIFDDHRRLQSVELEVPDWDQLTIKAPPIPDPFKLSVRPVSDLFQFHADAGEQHRARLMGVVTLSRADGSFYLQDASGGLEIQPAAGATAPTPGSMADVVGFPVIVDRAATLQEAVFHHMRGGAALEPAELKPDTVVEETLQSTLVRVQGQVLGHFSHGAEEVLTVRFGQRPIDAVLEKQSGDDRLDDIEPGALVRLTGVYEGQRSSASAGQAFRLLLRSPTDVAVLSLPTWWTVRRTLWALAAVGGVLLLALGWVRSLRRQVRQRTSELHEEIDHHRRTEARLEAEIAERKRMESEVERSHQELITASRQAGMAEVATSVLHNVGNVLNSVNVSAGLVSEKIRNSKVTNLSRVAELIKEHSGNLSIYLENDPKGKQLPQYLSRLAQHLDSEQKAILAELDSLAKNVEHIKGIVGMQQNYAKVFGSAEPIKPTELVEDALRLNGGALVRHEVKVIREYEPNLPEITVDKHKLLQILVNLICNAKKACDESLYPEKLLTVKVARSEDRLKISVIDNGVGIPKENLTRIFNHGFTTRKDGHGFGLHSGALAAKEMGGSLIAHSDGHGKGASFTVELPVQSKPAEPDPAI